MRPRAIRAATVLALALSAAAGPGACVREDARRTYERGVADLEKGRVVAALQSFETVLSDYPASPWAAQARERLAQVRGRGEALRAEGLGLEASDPPQAREKLRLADAVLGDDRGVLEALVRLYADVGDARTAKEYARRLTAAFPEEVQDPWVYVVIARGEHASYNPVLADQALEKAERLAERLGRPELVYLVRVERFQFHAKTGETERRLEAAERILADFPARAEEAGVLGFYRETAAPYAVAGEHVVAVDRPAAGARPVEALPPGGRTPVVFTRSGWARVITPSGRLGFIPVSEITNRPFALVDARARWLREEGTGLLLPAVGFRVRNTGAAQLGGMEVKAEFVVRDGGAPPRDLGATAAAPALGDGGLPPGRTGSPVVLSAARGVRLGLEEGAPALGARLYYRTRGESEWRFVMRVVGDRVEEIGRP